MKACKYLVLLLVINIWTGCKSTQLTEFESRYILNDTGKDKFYLVHLIRENQKKGIFGPAPALFIEDQLIADSFGKLNKIIISKKQIQSVEIMPSEKSVHLFGARGKDGFIMVRTTGWKKPLP